MKYDELMDKIEVTDAMRARILRNVSAAAPKKTPVRRYALLVACLAVVLLGAVCVPKLMDPAPQGEQVAIANGMIEVADAAALADAVGFPAAEAAELPFDVEETTYTSYWGELAEICYAGGGQIADLRTSAGTEDNSGDYTDYPAVTELTVGTVTAELRGGALYARRLDGRAVHVFPAAVGRAEHRGLAAAACRCAHGGVKDGAEEQL